MANSRSFKDIFSGHISIGKLTIYGNNAMHWGVTLRTKKYGYVCFRLPFGSCGKWWPLYLYCSPNATPWAATFMIGRIHSEDDWALSRIRRKVFGHNFEVYKFLEDYGCRNYDILYAINDSVGLHKCSYDAKGLRHYWLSTPWRTTDSLLTLNKENDKNA